MRAMTDPIGAEVKVIVEKLTAEFDQIPPDRVARVVEEQRAELADARIWEYVPLLIESAARRRLAQVQRQPADVAQQAVG